jgi:hypothetical protein
MIWPAAWSIKFQAKLGIDRIPAFLVAQACKPLSHLHLMSLRGDARRHRTLDSGQAPRITYG